MSNISLPLGSKGSGRARYAAAMELYQSGKISAEVLEMYRISSGLDGQDPEALLADSGGMPQDPAPPEVLVRRLIDEADRYLSGLHGPGVGEVRRKLNLWRGGAVTLCPQVPALVAEHLGAALDGLGRTHLALAQAIAAAAPHLHWRPYDSYPEAEIGTLFAQGHSYATLMGEHANIAAQHFDFGLFLIAPHVLYRDHRHRAAELYAPLTGPHGWRFGSGTPLIIKPAHVPVWNPPDRPHLTKVGPHPFLCLYGWTSEVEALAEVLPAADWPALEALRLEASAGTDHPSLESRPE
ncbi:hypothetical protein GC209_14410 [bacterium]|nr:hypothetical protein [bacterium]